jgi:hypothetical protein
MISNSILSHNIWQHGVRASLLRAALLMVLMSYIPAIHAESQNSSDATELYKKFATAFIMGELLEASAYAKGEALRVVRRKQHLLGADNAYTPPVATEILIVGEKFSEEVAQVELMGVLLARHPIPGLKKLATRVHRQNITLQRFDAGWMVVYFMDNLEKCCLPLE